MSGLEDQLNKLNKDYHEKEAERKREEARRQREEELEKFREQEEQSQREYQRKLERHQQKYQCEVCGKPSDGPGYDPTSSQVVGKSLQGPVFEVSGGDVNWDSPTGLEYCNMCHELFCSDHILHIEDGYTKVCESCAQSLLQQGISYSEWRDKNPYSTKKGGFFSFLR